MKPTWQKRTLVIVAAAFLSGCVGEGGEARRPPPTVVDVTPAMRGDISTSLTLDGQIAPLFNATLSSPQSGNVTAVLVNEGDRVRAGQLLATIDDAPLRAQLAQARGQVVAAQGHLRSSALSQPIQSTQYDATLGQARARVDADRAALANAKVLYDGNVRLYPQGYIAQTTLEQSRAAYVAAQQQMNQDEAALTSARASLGQSQADMQTVEANRGALEQARGLVKELQVEIEQTQVRAPFNGVVTARLLDPGAFAGPNQPIVTVSHLDTVYVNVNVPDGALAYTRPGTRVTFTTTSLPGKTFNGTIFELNAVPTQGTLSYRARIRYPNADDGFALRGGMLVNVIVRKESRRGVVVIPRTAVFQSDSGDNVFVVRGGKAVQMPVRVGLQTDTSAEVSGISPGAQVITARPDALQNGAEVAVNGSRAMR